MHSWVPTAVAFLGVAVAQEPTPAPLGQLIDVGGYRIHLHCTGMGSPTVVVAGGGFSFDWVLVQSQVAKPTRICTYDPSGTAWSDPSPELLNCSGRVEELHSLLRGANVEPPYVVAGLSVGALVARLYARRHPGDVLGAIMVDHAFLDVGANASPPAVAGLDSPPVLIYKEPINLTAEETSDFRKLPQSAQQLHHWATSLNPKLPTVETAEDCLAHLAGDSLGRKPLAVVSTANDHPNYKKLQEQLLALSTRSRQFLADGSFHSVEIDQPDVVVAAIRWVFEALREP